MVAGNVAAEVGEWDGVAQPTKGGAVLGEVDAAMGVVAQAETLQQGVRETTG